MAFNMGDGHARQVFLNGELSFKQQQTFASTEAFLGEGQPVEPPGFNFHNIGQHSNFSTNLLLQVAGSWDKNTSPRQNWLDVQDQ